MGAKWPMPQEAYSSTRVIQGCRIVRIFNHFGSLDFALPIYGLEKIFFAAVFAAAALFMATNSHLSALNMMMLYILQRFILVPNVLIVESTRPGVRGKSLKGFS